MLAAEGAEFVHFNSVGVILLVLARVIVSLLAFRANHRDLDSHLTAPPN
jgi:hypothetical protein